MPIPQSSPCGPCLPRTSPLLLEINHYPIMVISCLPFLCSFTTEIRNFKQCSWILPPFFVVCFVCFWLCLQHIEVPGPGIESQWQQLQPLSGSGNYQVLSHFKLHKRAILYGFFFVFLLTLHIMQFSHVVVCRFKSSLLIFHCCMYCIVWSIFPWLECCVVSILGLSQSK